MGGEWGVVSESVLKAFAVTPHSPLPTWSRHEGDAREVPGPLRRCPACERVYWRGSHARRMEAALATAFVG